MPTQRLSPTMISFLVLFSGSALLVLFWITLESLFIKRLTFTYLFLFSIPATLVILIGMIGLLMFYVWLRLWTLKRVSMRIMKDRSSNSENRICRSLLRLPTELFWVTIAYGGLFIPVYHVVHFIVEGNSLLRVEEQYWLNFLRSFLYEQTIVLSVAILHYAVARRLVRPMLLKLNHVSGNWPYKSFLSMLTTTFAGLLLVNIFSILWYVIVAIVKEKSIELEVLGTLIVFNSVFALSIFVLLAFEFRRELQVLIGSIRDWLNGDRSLHSSRMPILSHDEVGQLAIVFNRLQDRVNQEYEELKRDLEMARMVQRQLLPAPVQRFKEYEIMAITESHHAVGNGFYDVISLENKGFTAFAGGTRGAGMSAALHMSAALMLLRAEIEQESSPEHTMIRFNQGINELFPQEDQIAASLINVDTNRNVLRVALQGGMNIRQIHNGQLRLPPLDDEIPFFPGDRWLLYSESAMEAVVALELEPICRSESQLPLNMSMDTWTTRFMNRSPSAHIDFTIVLITRHTMEEEWNESIEE